MSAQLTISDYYKDWLHNAAWNHIIYTKPKIINIFWVTKCLCMSPMVLCILCVSILVCIAFREVIKGLSPRHSRGSAESLMRPRLKHSLIGGNVWEDWKAGRVPCVLTFSPGGPIGPWGPTRPWKTIEIALLLEKSKKRSGLHILKSWKWKYIVVKKKEV